MSVLSLAAGFLAALLFPRLSAEVVVVSAVRLEGGHLRAKLVVRNTGLVPVRIGTLVGDWAGGADGWLGWNYRPDLFKSDPPAPEQSAARVVTLQSGESCSFPIEQRGVRGRDGKFRIEATYETGTAFTARHGTWAGRVTAKPVVFHLKQLGLICSSSPVTHLWSILILRGTISLNRHESAYRWRLGGV